ncbi:MAG: DUF4180 domain-containing protein [Marinilabiliales bacterium]|nr:DUF4180 domain-containing protein [Marinilabiliales bacterium]
MIIYYNPSSADPIAELKKGTLIISSSEEILDLIGDVRYTGCSRLIIHASSLSGEFFDLRTGVAGGDPSESSRTTGCGWPLLGDFFAP